MKTFLILAVVLNLSSCAKQLPKYPEQLKTFHVLKVRDLPFSDMLWSQVVNTKDLARLSPDSNLCLRFEVQQTNPIKVKFIQEDEMEACNELTGFTSNETVSLFNWIDDVMKFAEEHNCFDKNQNP